MLRGKCGSYTHPDLQKNALPGWDRKNWALGTRMVNIIIDHLYEGARHTIA